MHVKVSGIGRLVPGLQLTDVYPLEGDAGMKEYVLRTSKKSALSASAITQSLETLRARVRVYFPSQRTVASSIGGKNVSLYH